MDRRATWARNFRRFGLSDDTSQRSTPQPRQKARFSRVTRTVGGVDDATDCWSQARRERPVAASTVSRPSSRALQSLVRIGASRR